MVTLIVGKKGSGKTKKLVDAANAAVRTISGNVVVIEPKEKLTREIAHEARLISLEPYNIQDADQLFGFLGGICASNYDIQEIYVDSVLRVIGEASLPAFIDKIEKLAEYAETKITFSVSIAEEDVPEELRSRVEIVS